MNTVGIFAGRGDVILGMLMALLFGTAIGWYLKGVKDQVVSWWKSRRK